MTEQHVPPLDDLPLSASDVELPEGAHAATVDTPVQVRSLAKRELDVRIMPWNTSVETPSGPEEFRAGAFSDVDPDRVLLMGLEHEVHLGLGQNGNVVPTRRPTGKGLTLEERDDGAYMTFRVAKTAAGDEMLALAEAEVVRGVSVEFVEIPGGTTTETRNGRRTRIHHRVALPAVSPTYRPAYVGAQVLAVRSQQEVAPVAEQEAPANGAAEEQEPQLPVQYRGGFDVDKALTNFEAGMTKITDTFGDRLERLEERARSTFEIPGAPTKEDKKPSLGTWMEVALKILSGERIPNEQMRVTQDFITTDNAGVVPDAYSDRIIGVIDPARPFMATTERIPTPDSGMSLVVPDHHPAPVGRRAGDREGAAVAAPSPSSAPRASRSTPTAASATCRSSCSSGPTPRSSSCTSGCWPRRTPSRPRTRRSARSSRPCPLVDPSRHRRSTRRPSTSEPASRPASTRCAARRTPSGCRPRPWPSSSTPRHRAPMRRCTPT